MSDLVGNPEDRFSRIVAHICLPPTYSLAFYRPCSSTKQTPYSKYKDNSEVAFSMIFNG